MFYSLSGDDLGSSWGSPWPSPGSAQSTRWPIRQTHSNDKKKIAHIWMGKERFEHSADVRAAAGLGALCWVANTTNVYEAVDNCEKEKFTCRL